MQTISTVRSKKHRDDLTAFKSEHHQNNKTLTQIIGDQVEKVIYTWNQNYKN